MNLPSKLEKYLVIDTALETSSYKAYAKMGDSDRKALFYAMCEKWDIASDSFVDSGIARRANIILVLKSLVRKGDTEFGNYFKQFFYHKDNFVFYTAILAYAACMQEKAYPDLLEIIYNTNAPKDIRVYALYELSIIAGQKFITNNLPADEREWVDADFPLAAIKLWDSGGRIKGNAYADVVHEKVLNPDNEIDRLIAAIHKKYYVNTVYISRRDIIDGKKNIGYPSVADIEKINLKWLLPTSYKYFIENFVVKSELKREICIYSADELIERQRGFAFDLENNRIPEWNADFLVIADWNGDTMYCLDLSKGESSPVYMFRHDDWTFKKYAVSFLEFLAKIV